MEGTYPIGDDQVAWYQENGYIRLPGVLRPDEVEGLRAVLSEALETRREQIEAQRSHSDQQRRYQKVFTQMVNLWTDHEGIRPFVLSRRLAEIARRLARVPSVRLFHDHALIKPARDGAPTAWHQDLPYWPMHGSGALSCWIALDDVDESNGCLQFIPGSHAYGPLDPVSLTDPQDIFEQVGETATAVKPAVMAMSAGSVTYHDGLTFHHAGPNVSERARRALAIIYIPEGVTHNAAKPHIVTNGLNLPDRSPFDHPLFPVLAGV